MFEKQKARFRLIEINQRLCFDRFEEQLRLKIQA
jgi:hypothetical protein